MEKSESRRYGLVATVGVHLLVLLIFTQILAWTPPDPPVAEFGMVVNFGTDEAGYGETQTYGPSSDNDQLEEARPNENTEESRDNRAPEPAKTDEQAKELTTEDEESPEVAKNTTSEKPKEEVKSTNKGNEEPKKTSEGTPDSKGTSDKNASNNNGNQPGKVGDQGDKSGDINSDALIGKGSGVGGASLDMAGWKWDQKPVVNDRSDETGKIVFEITIDEEGEVINVRELSSTVNKTVSNNYKKAVYDLTFSPSVSTRPGARTVGRITFIIKSK